MPSPDDLIKALKEQIAPLQQQHAENVKAADRERAEHADKIALQQRRNEVFKGIAYDCLDISEEWWGILKRELAIHFAMVETRTPEKSPEYPSCTATFPQERDFNQKWTIATGCCYDEATQKVTISVVLDGGFAQSEANYDRKLKIDIPSEAIKVNSQLAEFIHTSISELVLEYMKIRAAGDKTTQ